MPPVTMLLRLHLNENPWGPPGASVRRLREAASRAHLYPDLETDQVEGALGSYLGLPAAQVMLTTGVDEATDLCLLEFGRLRVVTPGFAGFTDRARALGFPYQSYPLDGWNGLPASLLADVDQADLVMLASPNNPTGMAFAEEEIRRLIERGCHVLLDQTYVDFAGGASVEARYWLDACERVLLFRSFSKGFGLGGLRIGALLGNPHLIGRLRSRRAYASVDRLAVEAVLGVLEEEPDFPIQLASRIAVQRRALIRVLRSSGLFESVLDSVASFVLTICASEAATRKLRDQLRDEAGVLVALGAAFGVDCGLRFSVPDDAGLTRVEDALRAIRDGQRRIDDDELARRSPQPECQPLR